MQNWDVGTSAKWLPEWGCRDRGLTAVPDVAV